MLVIRTLLGLLLLTVLAYLGGHPRVQRWERTLGISQVITAGFPFVLLGMLAHVSSLGVLDDRMLQSIEPFLRIGLGWIGFTVGFRFDARLFTRLPSNAAQAVGIATTLPFACVLLTSALSLFLLSGSDWSSQTLSEPLFLRDALILGTAGAMTANTTARLLRPSESTILLSRVLRLEELAALLGLAIIAAYFRPHGPQVSWQLPGTAWFLLTIGLGVTVGAIVYAILQRPRSGPEFTVLMLGSVSFAAGVAGYLHLSSLVVTFVSGVLLANFPGDYQERLGATLQRLERPMYLFALTIMGALWRVDDWRGWVLMPVFVVARLAGKWLAVKLAARKHGLELRQEDRLALGFSPLSPLAIVIVINAQLLYPDGSITRLVTAVIGAAIITEIVVQLLRPKQMTGSAETA